MHPGGEIMASQLAGEFTLPNTASQKLVFIAGGIGITPYRSILKFLLDTKQKWDIILLYSNKTADEIIYKDFFDQAEKNLGLKTIYINTNADGRINSQTITSQIPDFRERIFYLSGPHSLVTSFADVLHGLGVSQRQIKIDFFPGYA